MFSVHINQTHRLSFFVLVLHTSRLRARDLPGIWSNPTRPGCSFVLPRFGQYSWCYGIIGLCSRGVASCGQRDAFSAPCSTKFGVVIFVCLMNFRCRRTVFQYLKNSFPVPKIIFKTCLSRLIEYEGKAQSDISHFAQYSTDIPKLFGLSWNIG